MTMSLRRALALLPLAAAAARGQTHSDARALETLRRSNDQLRRIVLDNGMIALIKTDRSAPVVSIQIWVGSGSIHEGEWLGGGLSHYLEHMVFKGSSTRAPGEITRAIHDAGGRINAYTTYDRTVFFTDIPAPRWRTGLDVLSDAVLHPSFPEGEWLKERDVILRERAMCDDDPDRAVGELFWQTAFRLHPLRVPVIGYAEVIRAMTRDDLLAYHARHYRPDNIVVAVVGDVELPEAESAVRAAFSNTPRRAFAPAPLPPEPAQQAPRLARKTGPYQVGRLIWGCHTVSVTHPDAPTLDLLAALTGHGRSARLTREIQERRKLAHRISAWSYTPKEPGVFAVSAEFDPQHEADLVEAIRREIARWSKEGFSRQEIAKARRMMLVDELSSLQTMNGQAGHYAAGESIAGNARFSEQYLQALHKVTDRDLRLVAARYLRPERMTLAVLAPELPASASRTNETTAQVGPVQRMLLHDGVPLLHRADERLPFVWFCVALRGGSLLEPSERPGITRLMAELLTRGAGKRSAEETAATVESLGAELTPFSGYNSFGLRARCLAGDAEMMAGLIADCLSTPVFAPSEVEKQKILQQAALKRREEKPLGAAQQMLEDALFPDHPYRFPPEGSREGIAHTTREELLAHFRRLVVRGNVVISIFGHVTTEEAQRMGRLIAARIRPDQAPAVPALAAQPVLPLRVEQERPWEQAIVVCGFPGITLNDPRRDALDVLHAALNGLSSNLALAIREQRGLAYFTGAMNRPGWAPGYFALYAGTKPSAVGEVESLMAAEARRLAERGLRDEEIERARNQLIADKDFALQDHGEQAMSCALNELYDLGFAYDLEAPNRLRALRPETLREVAASLLDTNKMALVIVRPSTTMLPSAYTP